LRRFGDSDKPWDGYSYDTMSDDLKAVFDTQTKQHYISWRLYGRSGLYSLYGTRSGHVTKHVLLGAAAPCFSRREDFPYGIDKSAVDDLMLQGTKQEKTF
jgi:non-heme chloroperoxidase